MDFICAIAAELQRCDPSIKLCIIGDGRDSERIRNSIAFGNAENIEMLGTKSQESTVAYLQGARFLVNTSHFEGCPNTVLEAFACAKPVIAFDALGIRNLVTPGKNGLLVPLYDIHEFAKNIHHLYRNDDMRHRLGRSAREYVAEYHNWRLIGERVTEVYEHI